MSQMIFLGMMLPAAAVGVCAVLTVVARRRAVRTGFVARPQQDRYHRSVIALGGGIAIFWTLAIFILCGATFVAFVAAPGHANWLSPGVQQHAAGFMDKLPDLLVVLAVAMGLHLLGLWDDKKHLGPFFKLGVQFAAAIVAAVWADVRVEMFIENKVITTALSVVWIVLMINVFNFLDNMDGLSAGIAAIATAALMTAAFVSGQVFVGAMGLVFSGTLVGFLVFNFPPATIFMGDAGSMVVGYFVALLTLRTTYYNPEVGTPLYSVLMPAVVMAVPLYDFVTVTFLRLKQGKSPFVGDTQHFSHRLKRRGLTDRQVALTLYLATLCTAIGGVILQQVGLVGAALVAAQTVMILVIVGIFEATGNISS
ncbi:MAG: undecaprenyl/decaprenyl-phosphate alpha-N-acetylglucosaminyl 1-phosphate transferase [Phycisphaerae bacterium]|nr:undecaprenyl/decaprenyl-phosphate alpha-N-acetylglucosaminyl 1-phosphate transferase [Phycisphaerae bacterium]